MRRKVGYFSQSVFVTLHLGRHWKKERRTFHRHPTLISGSEEREKKGHKMGKTGSFRFQTEF